MRPSHPQVIESLLRGIRLVRYRGVHCYCPNLGIRSAPDKIQYNETRIFNCRSLRIGTLIEVTSVITAIRNPSTSGFSLIYTVSNLYQLIAPSRVLNLSRSNASQSRIKSLACLRLESHIGWLIINTTI